MKLVKKSGYTLSAAAALLLLSGGNSQASSCTTSLLSTYADTLDAQGYNGSSTTSATISVCGYSITMSGSVPLDTLTTSNSGTFSLGGKTVYVETNASTLDAATSANTLLVTVDGVQQFNGTISTATISEILALSSLLTFNGKTVDITTDITGLTYNSLDTAADNTYDANTITVTVDGVVVYSGLIGSLTAQNGADFLAALGAIDNGTVVQQDVQRTASTVTTGMVSRRVSSVLRSVKSKKSKGSGGGSAPDGSGQKPKGQDDRAGIGLKMTGLSSGDGERTKGLWFSAGSTWMKSSDQYAPYRGNMQIAMVGADIQTSDNLLIGVTLGIESTNIDTSFNNGGVEIFGATITPYLGYMFFDGDLTLGIQAGYGIFNNESIRNPGGTKISGSYTTERVLLNSDVDYYKNIGESNWTLNSTLGALLVWDYRDDYTESDGTQPIKNDTVLGEAKVGATLFYAENDVTEFYAGAVYLYDFLMDQDFDTANNEDRDEYNVSIGMDYVNEKDHIFTVDMTKSLGRKDTDTTSAQVNYRIPF
jgi:hypothetical protein